MSNPDHWGRHSKHLRDQDFVRRHFFFPFLSLLELSFHRSGGWELFGMEENLRTFTRLHSKLLLPFTHSPVVPGQLSCQSEFLTHEFHSQECWGAGGRLTFPGVLRRRERGHINMSPVSGHTLGWRLCLPFPIHHTHVVDTIPIFYDGPYSHPS